MDSGLKNRVAIVAASSQGIGRATAEGFAAEGCKVAMCARNETTLTQEAEAIRQRYGVEVLGEAFDVTQAPAVHGFVAEVAARLGGEGSCCSKTCGAPRGGRCARIEA